VLSDVATSTCQCLKRESARCGTRKDGEERGGEGGAKTRFQKSSAEDSRLRPPERIGQWSREGGAQKKKPSPGKVWGERNSGRPSIRNGSSVGPRKPRLSGRLVARQDTAKGERRGSKATSLRLLVYRSAKVSDRRHYKEKKERSWRWNERREEAVSKVDKRQVGNLMGILMRELDKHWFSHLNTLIDI